MLLLHPPHNHSYSARDQLWPALGRKQTFTGSAMSDKLRPTWVADRDKAIKDYALDKLQKSMFGQPG